MILFFDSKGNKRLSDFPELKAFTLLYHAKHQFNFEKGLVNQYFDQSLINYSP
jgi:hypothetical protein